MEYLRIFYDWVVKQNIFITGLASLFAIGGIIWGVLKIWSGVFSKIMPFQNLIRQKKRSESLRFISQLNGQWWAMGASNGKPSMQVVGDFHVTDQCEWRTFNAFKGAHR